MSELLLSGCTNHDDHHYVFPAGCEDAVDIEVAAARRSASRAADGGSMNLSQRDGGLPPDSVVQGPKTRSWPTDAAWWRNIISAARMRCADCAPRHARRSRSRPR